MNKNIREFVNTRQTNTKSPWDNYLITMSLILNKAVTELKNALNEEQKPKLKRILAEMSHKIMQINIEIWKYRCKRLYSEHQEITYRFLK